MEFQLTAAEILGDGLIARLRFEAGVSVGQSPVNRLTDTGLPDYLPAVYANNYLKVNGTNAEVIGVQSEEWNMPMSWIDPPASGGSLTAGTYFFLVAIQDSTGNEVYVSPSIWGYADTVGEIGTTISANQKITFSWRIPCPVGGQVNIYACTQKPLVGNLRRVAALPYASLTSKTSYTLTAFGSDNSLYVPKFTVWTLTCKLPNTISFNQPVTINAPASLLLDEKGNYTQSVTNYTATNRSVVGSDGFLATPENVSATYGTLTFAQTIYISYSHGVNTTGAGTFNNPYKTVSYAMSKISSATRNARFCLLRGDTFPSDVWNRAYWGTSYDKPSLFDSYWNPAYGPDPGTRPIVVFGDPYYDLPAKNLDATQLLWQQSDSTNQTSGNGKHPYQYMRGLSFRYDLTYPNTGESHITNSTEDWVIISDCEFQNICLVSTYGSPQFIAPVGCIFHRCIIQQAHDSPIHTYADAGSSGTSLILPDKFINPWAGFASSGIYLIVAGQTSIRLFRSGAKWKISGWKITVTEGTKTETKTITTNGGNSVWNVNSPWANSYTRTGCSISLDPTNQQFQILAGTGTSSTTYTISSYNPSTRTATVTPAMPTLDSTSRIAFLPLGYNTSSGHVQGFFMSHCGDWLFSQNVFDKNGWNWFNDVQTYNDIFNHNIYLSAMTRNVVCHSNYLLRANSVGAQLRGGGVFAYNILGKNTHGNNLINGGMAYKNVYWNQGHYSCNASTPGSHTPHHINDFNIVLKARGALENGVPNQQFNGSNCFNADEVAYMHSYIALRHNTYVDAGAFQLGNRLPVPGKLIIRNNISVNRPATAIDYLNNKYITSNLNTLRTNWQINGNSTVPAVIASRVDIDQNAYRITTQSGVFRWPDVYTNNFATWQASGRDPNSICFLSDPSFQNGFYGMAEFAVEKGIGTTFDDVWGTLTTRQSGVWNDYHDAATCYRSFANAYKPQFANVPTLGKYYGTIDYSNVPLAASAGTALASSSVDGRSLADYLAVGTASGDSTVTGRSAPIKTTRATAAGNSTANGYNILISIGTANAGSSAIGLPVKNLYAIATASGNSSANATNKSLVTIEAIGTVVANSLAIALGQQLTNQYAIGTIIASSFAIANPNLAAVIALANGQSSVSARGSILSTEGLVCATDGTLIGKANWLYTKKAYIPAITVCIQHIDLRSQKIKPPLF